MLSQRRSRRVVNLFTYIYYNCYDVDHVYDLYFCVLNDSAVQTPGFSPPAPAPAKKTPAPVKKLRLRQKTCEN